MIKFLLVAICWICHLTIADDQCRLNNFHNNETEEGVLVTRVEIPQICTEGEFDWDYPEGHIYLSAVNPNRVHSLCIEILFDSAMLGAVSDVTNGTAIPLELPTQGQPTCTIAVKGKVELLIEAVKVQLYWTSFGYRVNLL